MDYGKIPWVTVYKPTARSKEHHPWLIAYKDPLTQRRTVKTGVADMDLTYLKAMEISRNIQAVKAGLVDPRQERRKIAASRPILEHVDEWREVLHANGDTPSYIEMTINRVKRIVAEIKAKTILDLTPSAVKTTIDGLEHERATRNAKAISSSSKNHYLRAIKMFSKWMEDDKRSAEDELKLLRPWNAETDLRHERRPLSMEALNQLLNKTETGIEHHNMPGEERARLYKFAVFTGLRASEIRSLTKDSFAFAKENSCITVLARYSKRRQLDVIPVTEELSKELRPIVEKLPEKYPVFNVPAAAGRMLKRDLKAAGIPYELAGKFLDFHSLRHTAITRVMTGTNNLRIAQTFARHSMPTLTARYAHCDFADLANALAALPALRSAPRGINNDGVQRPAQRASVACETDCPPLPS